MPVNTTAASILAAITLFALAWWHLSAYGLKQELPVSAQQLSAYQLAALTAQQQGNFPQAESLWCQTIATATSSRNDKALWQAHYQLAKLYGEWGYYNKAIDEYERFLRMKQLQKEQYHGLAWSQSELADLYAKADRLLTAIAYYKEALNNWDEFGRIPEMISTYDHLGLAYRENDDISSAYECFRQALHHYEKALALPGLQDRKYYFMVAAALAAADYGDTLAAAGMESEAQSLHKQSRALWFEVDRFLAENGKPSDVFPYASLQSMNPHLQSIRTLADFYCGNGRRADADALYNLLFALVEHQSLSFTLPGLPDRAQLIATIYRWKNHCDGANGFAAERLGRGGSSGFAVEEFNPYLHKFTATATMQDCFEEREQLCHQYAWAIPDDKALSVLATHQPLVEVGAGTGYWACLLKKMGVDILAYDVSPVQSGGNAYHIGARKSWAEVTTADETVARLYPQRTLFLCWPPDINECAYNAVRLYKGNTIIYVGEGPGGCTGSKAFHDELAAHWHLVEQVSIPQWTGTYDSMFIYSRKAPYSIHQSQETNAVTLKTIEQLLGPRLSSICHKSPTAWNDLKELLDAKISVKFVSGPCQAFYDQDEHTVSIGSACDNTHKVLAIAHEYAHAILFPTTKPRSTQITKSQFVSRSLEQEKDVITHELMVATELRAAGIKLDKATAQLLSDFQKDGRSAVSDVVLSSTTSSSNESYSSHFSQWYDEVTLHPGSKPGKGIH